MGNHRSGDCLGSACNLGLAFWGPTCSPSMTVKYMSARASSLSQFSEITQVPFPPVYDKFLTIIGIFSFDLGWMLSAACLATKVGFYDKLL